MIETIDVIAKHLEGWPLALVIISLIIFGGFGVKKKLGIKIIKDPMKKKNNYENPNKEKMSIETRRVLFGQNGQPKFVPLSTCLDTKHEIKIEIEKVKDKNDKQSNKITRVETMLEMIMKQQFNMEPPKAKYDNNIPDHQRS